MVWKFNRNVFIFTVVEMSAWSGTVRDCEVPLSFGLLGFLWVSCFDGREEPGLVVRCVCACTMGLSGGWWWTVGHWGSRKATFHSIWLLCLTKAGSTFVLGTVLSNFVVLRFCYTAALSL